MAAAVTYSPTVYNNLPMLADAGKTFDIKQGEALLEEFRQLFQKHKTDRVFGLVLNHRHFEMSADEQLVEYRGTSVPWNHMLDKIQPSTWIVLEDDSCSPYEFHYSPEEKAFDDENLPGNPKYTTFIQEFNQILRQNDAIGLLGLCRYPGDDFEGRVEITEGRANINLSPNDAPAGVPSRAAAWFFSPLLLGKCVCICGGNGHTNATHQGHVNSR